MVGLKITAGVRISIINRLKLGQSFTPYFTFSLTLRWHSVARFRAIQRF